MLARAERLVRAADYREVVRRGRRLSTANATVYARPGDDSVNSSRFGFIVSKAVGNAVVRNRVRRRLKAICHSEIDPAGPVLDIVIRAHAPSATASWSELVEDVSGMVARLRSKLAATPPPPSTVVIEGIGSAT